MTGGALSENVHQDPQGLHRPSEVKTASFRVEVDRGEVTVVAPVGELDIVTVEALDGALRHAFDSGCRHVVLDLRGLSFMDSHGIHLVMRWNSLAERSGVTFNVVQGGAAIRRLFEIVGLLDQLPFVAPDGDGSAAVREIQA